MKRIISLLVFFFIILQLVAQTKTVHLRGIVKDTSLKSIEISHVVDAKLSKWEEKNVDVVNGAFNTSIQIPFPVEITLSYRNRIFGNNFIYNDAEILIDSAGEPHIIGSAIQDEYENDFLLFFKTNDNLFDSATSFSKRNRQKYGRDFPKAVQDSLNLLKEEYSYQRAKLYEQYIKSHPDSYVALWNIYYFISLFGNLNEYINYDKLLLSFSNQMQEQSFISALKEKVQELEKMQVGQIFPKDFFKGHEQLQSKIKSNNQYYLIDFWYSHCAPCVAQFPRLKEIYNQFHDKGFDIVSISIDKQKDEKDYSAAIKKNKLAWNHVWDKDGVTAEKFNVHTFPTYILLDKNDRIINFDIHDHQLETFLKEHL